MSRIKYRVQFYVAIEELREIEEFAKEHNRSVSNLTLHALRTFMRRYPLKRS